MKKSIFLFISLFALISVTAVLAKTINNPKEFIMDTMKKYSTTGYHILHETSVAPCEYDTGDYTISTGSADFMMYVDSREETDIIHLLNLIVHEMCHDYTSRMIPVISKGSILDFRGYFAFYIGDKETVLVKKTGTFKTFEMASSFPSDLKTFRFEQYIGTDGDNFGTQVNGIYGLLGEMNAYYHGTKAMMDMIPYFKNSMPRTRKTWEKYLENTGDSLFGCIEQKMFVLRYLLFAEKKHPEIYRDIIANKEFREAYTKIDQNINSLLKRYGENIQEICGILKNNGLDAKISGGALYIGSSGIESFVSDREKLLRELSGSEYARMKKILNK